LENSYKKIGCYKLKKKDRKRKNGAGSTGNQRPGRVEGTQVEVVLGEKPED